MNIHFKNCPRCSLNSLGFLRFMGVDNHRNELVHVAARFIQVDYLRNIQKDYHVKMLSWVLSSEG